jgi:hypothetical protein
MLKNGCLQSQQLTEFLRTEDKHFTSLLNTQQTDFLETLRDNQQKFDDTQAKAKAEAVMKRTDRVLGVAESNLQATQKNLDAITGGNSYPEISIGFRSDEIPVLQLIAEIKRTQYVGEFDYAVDQTDDDCPFSHRTPKFLGISGRTGPMRNMLHLASHRKSDACWHHSLTKYEWRRKTAFSWSVLMCAPIRRVMCGTQESRLAGGSLLGYTESK